LHIASSSALTDTKLLTLQLPEYSNKMEKYSTQWPTDPAPLLTYYAELMKIGPTHTHIPDTDPLTTPPSQVIGWAQQFLSLKQFHLPPASPTTQKAASINYKSSNNDNNYNHPLGKSL
jgi:hypothetical protein